MIIIPKSHEFDTCQNDMIRFGVLDCNGKQKDSYDEIVDVCLCLRRRADGGRGGRRMDGADSHRSSADVFQRRDLAAGEVTG